MSDQPACATAGVDMFPERDDVAGNRRAVAVCRRCPLIKACAAGAFERAEQYGVWGALTEIKRGSKLRNGRAPTTGVIAKRVAERRKEVAHLIALGVRPNVIAARLGCTPGTIKGDLEVLRAGQPAEERAAAKAAAAAELDRRIDDMNAAGSSIDTICASLKVGPRRVVDRRRAVAA